MTSKLIEKDGRKLLYGKMEPAQLFFDFPLWKPGFEQYKADSALVKQLSDVLPKDLEVLVFLGTWCGDSRREVPRFLRLAREAGIQEKQLRLYGVDVVKKMEGTLIDDYQIKRVPTFVFLLKGKEVGRITEYPVQTLEADLLGIFKGK